MKRNITFIAIIVIVGVVAALAIWQPWVKKFVDTTGAQVTSNRNANVGVNVNSNSNTNLALNSNTNLDTIYPTEYTNELTNPFTHEVYYVRKWQGESWCGVNGSGVCDLMVKRGDQYIKVSNLFFRDSPKMEGTLQGAKLLKFTNANTLIIHSDAFDHGGGYSAVYSYNLETRQLTKLIYFVTAEFTNPFNYDVNYYSLERDGKKIVFSNYPDAYKGINQAGIFAVSGELTMSVTTNTAAPYTVQLDVDQYYDKDTVNMTINGAAYQFDFQTLSFK